MCGSHVREASEKTLELRCSNSKPKVLPILLCCLLISAPCNLSCYSSECLTWAHHCSHPIADFSWAGTMPYVSLVPYIGSKSYLSVSCNLNFSPAHQNWLKHYRTKLWKVLVLTLGPDCGPGLANIHNPVQGWHQEPSYSALLIWVSFIQEHGDAGNVRRPNISFETLEISSVSYQLYLQGQLLATLAFLKQSTILSFLLTDELRKDPLTEECAKLLCNFYIHLIPGPMNHLCAFDELQSQTNSHFFLAH